MIGRDAGNADSYIGSLKAQPWRLACEPTTGHIFVTCLGDGYVQRIDPATNSVVATIAVGIYPHEIIADDYGHIWVTHPWLDQLTRITVSNNAVATFPMAGEPYAIAKHPDGKLWISCSTEIVRFNPTNQEEMARINIASAGKYFPCGLAYNPVDQRIWFAVSGSDVVGIINPSGYALSWRNSGTWPAYASANASDDKGTVFVSLLYGNRVKLLRRSYWTRTVTENVHYGDGIVMPHSYEVTRKTSRSSPSSRPRSGPDRWRSRPTAVLRFQHEPAVLPGNRGAMIQTAWFGADAPIAAAALPSTNTDLSWYKCSASACRSSPSSSRRPRPCRWKPCARRASRTSPTPTWWPRAAASPSCAATSP